MNCRVIKISWEIKNNQKTKWLGNFVGRMVVIPYAGVIVPKIFLNHHFHVLGKLA
jgi:hypothetical protein